MSTTSSTSSASARRRRGVFAAVAVLVLALVLGLVSALGGAPDSGSGGESAAPAETSESPQAPNEALLALARRDDGDPNALGRADAPVVLIEYADFQCPFCGKFARDTAPELIEKYVESGVLRIEWRDFPIFGEESEAAARAGYAAGRQGRFWEFNEVAYSEDRKRNSGHFAEDKLVEMAREAGVKDLEKFRADMESADADKAIERDAREGYDLGVTSTPAFLVNDRPILGAQPTEVFVEAIEAAKKAAEEHGK
ncbi:DsbA family protein [Streptomyces megasporus]|uniref:DsbA family protein n=1 Tax=Streptomyces megasporus TaxID=44060 RepID=UPI0004E1B908|nr:DsbA family protein [Streptomyces megasporus]